MRLINMKEVDEYLRDYELLCESNFNKIPWDCCIKSIMAPRIREYNEYLSHKYEEYSIEDSYRDVKNRKRLLKELLSDDADFLSTYHPYVKQVRERLYFEEAITPIPSASILLTEGEDFFVILFNKPLLHFIHSFFAKANMLLQHTRTTGVMPKFHHIMLDEIYSDDNLYLAIFREIENFYHDKSYLAEKQYEYYIEPYDYCEQIIGARRFIIGHEIGHAHWVSLNHETVDRFTSITSPSLSLEQITELYCDSFALDAVLSTFLAENNHTESKFYELENIISGILLFFTMLDIVECFFGWRGQSKTHPDSKFRKAHIEKYLIKHRIMQAYPKLYTSFVRFVDCYRGLERFFIYQGQKGPVMKFLLEAPEEVSARWSNYVNSKLSDINSDYQDDLWSEFDRLWFQ